MLLIVKELVLTTEQILKLVKEIGKQVKPEVEVVGYIPEAGYRFGKALATFLERKLVDLDKVKRRLQNLLLVDCICDTGKTLEKYIQKFQPLQTAVLINRKKAGKSVKPDIVGLEYEKEYFLVGYGLDFNGRWRQLPFVCGGILKDGGSFYTKRRE
jgi:hypoxanthine phosphoribosyltransferase